MFPPVFRAVFRRRTQEFLIRAASVRVGQDSDANDSAIAHPLGDLRRGRLVPTRVRGLDVPQTPGFSGFRHGDNLIGRPTVPRV